MTSIIQMLRQISESEVKKLHILELGIVESVDIHSGDSDPVNYECSVIFPGRKTPEGKPLKMEKVPILTPHSGWVNIPYINDLVLVGFINGDFNLPIVLGRLHTAEKRAPVYEEGQFLIRFDPNAYQKDGPGATFMDIVFADGTEVHLEKELVSVTIGKTYMKIHKDGDVEVVSEAKFKLSTKDSIEIDSQSDIKIHAAGDINIEADGDINEKASKINLN